jgi:hypothetical protein
VRVDIDVTCHQYRSMPNAPPVALAFDVVPSSSLTSSHAWLGYFVVLAAVAAAMFAAGWVARGRS